MPNTKRRLSELTATKEQLYISSVGFYIFIYYVADCDAASVSYMYCFGIVCK